MSCGKENAVHVEKIKADIRRNLDEVLRLRGIIQYNTVSGSVPSFDVFDEWRAVTKEVAELIADWEYLERLERERASKSA